jgi:Holliday junction DNA helicase RuvA
MIHKLTGIVDTISETHLILDVAGVGYGVFAPSRVLSRLAPNAPASLWIETIVREDAITLYGFSSQAEHALFTLLLTVQGVGPKAALSILSALSASQISAAVVSGDAKAFTAASGVGLKTGERITAELKDKIAKAALAPEFAQIAAAARKTTVPEDAVAALVNLGYTRSQAFEAVMGALGQTPDAPLADLVKLSLQQLNNL